MIEIIRKKRDRGIHSREEINELVSGFVADAIPDYQVAAWLMAVYFNGLNDAETAFLTEAMMHSGDVLDLSEIPGKKVDKHSTGGVGDKTTLIVAPLVAAAGLSVAKMSGRGLGHTGGTLDKLESIPGFRVDLSPEQFKAKVRQHHIAICAQNARLVPADKKLYALRDVTATVDQVSLIASSVMSKKLACGADSIVIDLKVGKGAFIRTMENAEKLATIMQDTASHMGRRLTAVLSDMNQPLGYAIGNALEVEEAIRTLRGDGPADLTDLCLVLGAHMLVLGEQVATEQEGIERLRKLLDNGTALQKFKELVHSQGGDVTYIDNPSMLLGSPLIHHYRASQSGTVQSLNAFQIGLASLYLGAGRETKDSTVDPHAGMILHKKTGHAVQKGEVMATLYSNKESAFQDAMPYLHDAWTIGENPMTPSPLILKVIQG